MVFYVKYFINEECTKLFSLVLVLEMPTSSPTTCIVEVAGTCTIEDVGTYAVGDAETCAIEIVEICIVEVVGTCVETYK